jgi:hypothetical protein
MSTEHYTVVYRVSGDRDVHNEWWQSLHPLFLLDGDVAVKITVISKADEIARLENIRDILNNRPAHAEDALDAIDAELDRLEPTNPQPIGDVVGRIVARVEGDME